MKNYDQSVEINHNPNRPYIPEIRQNYCDVELNKTSTTRY